MMMQTQIFIRVVLARKCDLSGANVPYGIRSNGWTHGKRTDKKRLDKPFETNRLNGWTDANFLERLSRTTERM